MTRPLTRRRFLSVAAAACAVAGSAARADVPVARWSGVALGASASMQLAGLGRAEAAPVFAAVEAELDRLEGIFSLYREGSEIARLNRSGRLQAPSPELLALLSTCGALNDATGGAFDPTVQPVFAALADAAAMARAPDPAGWQAAVARVGWAGLRFDTGEVRLAAPGMAITLNGIAQGFITDRIAGLLRSRGLTDVLVDMGEIAALGHGPDGRAWRAGVATPQGQILKRLTLTDRALSTSAPNGTVLDPAGRIGHIFDPGTGRQADGCAMISVSAASATLADGLSTALCVLPRDRHAAVAARFPDTRIELTV